MAEPFFSIIVPVHDTAPDHLTACVDSLMAQSCGDFELIMVDDGSARETAAQVEQIAETDERVRAIRIEHAGASAARNAGLRQARGSYVVFVDSDDMLVRNALEGMKAALADEGVDMLWFGFQYLSPDGVIRKVDALRAASFDSAGDAVAAWVRADTLPVSACNKAYRRSVIEEGGIGFRAGVSFGEDRLFNLDFLARCGSAAIIPDNLYAYRLRDGSASHRFVPGMLELMLAIHEERMTALLPLLEGHLSAEELDAFATADRLKSAKKAWLHLAEGYSQLSCTQRTRELASFLAMGELERPPRGWLGWGDGALQRLWLAAVNRAARSQSLLPLRAMMRATTSMRGGSAT